MNTSQKVSWAQYAQTYDMLLQYNPFYQQLQQEVLEHTSQWHIQPEDMIADVGAGTGNYSIALASQFPQASVYHLDNDPGMNEVTRQKVSQQQLKNHFQLEKGIQEAHFAPESLQALISIHALYTFPKPQEALSKMYNWLKPGGEVVLVNAGRMVKVLDWQLALSWRLLSKYGLKKTLEIFREGKEVSKQNAYIREMQRQGTYWTHSHDEFCEAVEAAGFELITHNKTFRGISDLVVARKA